MRLEDKLAYRLLKESNHRVLNQYELYFLIENLFNDNSDKRLNEVDWRYLSDRAKIFAKYLRPMAGKSAQEKDAITQELLANAKANEMNKTKDGQPFTFKNSWKNPEYYKQGFRYLFGTIPSDVSTYLRRTKTRTDHILTDKGRARANHLLRKVMNGEKLDPTEITDINLIIGVADTNDPNNNGKRGSGSFAHRDVRTAFEGNPDLQQAMRRRFKDAGYTAISNEEETAEKEALKNRREKRAQRKELQWGTKVRLLAKKYADEWDKFDAAKKDRETNSKFRSSMVDNFKDIIDNLGKEITQSDRELYALRTQVSLYTTALTTATDKAKAKKDLDMAKAKLKAEEKHRQELSQDNQAIRKIVLGSMPKEPSISARGERRLNILKGKESRPGKRPRPRRKRK